MVRSPREKFTTSIHCGDWKRLSQSEAFEEASIAAMLELQADLPKDCIPQQAADSHQQMVGARKYLEILCAIHEPTKNPKPAAARGLDYQAGV